jgi:hypothetical protein
VLGISVGQQVDGMLRFGRVIDEARGAVDADPPELPPVIFVVVNEDGYRGIGRDVPQALEVGGALGLGVDRKVKSFAVGREGDRDNVRPSIRRRRRQVGDLRPSQALLHFSELHSTKYR